MKATKNLSKELANNLLEHFTDSCILTEVDGTIIFFSNQAEDLFKISGESVIDKNIKSILDVNFDKILKHKSSSLTFTYNIEEDDTKTIAMIANKHITGEDGKQLRLSIFRDVSIEKQLESTMDAYADNMYAAFSVEVEEKRKKLEHTQKILSNIIESMPSALILIDDKQNITLWNKQVEVLTNVKSEDAIGKKLSNVFEGLKRYFHFFDEILKEEKPMSFNRVSFDAFKHHYFNISFYPLVSEDEPGIVIRLDDISKLEKIEQHLNQAQKMESIGTLASGIAHDFNNVICGITAVISLMKFELSEGGSTEDLLANLDIIEHSGQQASNIVKQLLSLSKNNKLTIDYIDLIEAVNDIIQICKTSFDKSIAINVNIPLKEAMIKADKTQIEQVLLNICINASHAMTIMKGDNEKKGGELSINVEKVIVDADFLSTYPEASAKAYYCIKIKDTGVGIESKILKKIFDPFFTTKNTGKGSGLGLSMTYNIIKQHNGFIDIESEKHAGTTFMVYLPFVD